MMPIPGYDAVRCAWLRIESEGFVLHGFLLFTLGDEPFPEYLNGRGLADLDGWSGKECAVFVMRAPSQEWIDYTSSTNHSWWRVFGNADPATQKQMRKDLSKFEKVRFEFQGEQRTLTSILAPPVNEFIYRTEVERVLERFGCKSTEHPSLLLFRSLRDQSYWHVGLRDMVDVSPGQLRRGLREWFEGPEFRQIVNEARNA